jgi:hypothetical protein
LPGKRVRTGRKRGVALDDLRLQASYTDGTGTAVVKIRLAYSKASLDADMKNETDRFGENDEIKEGRYVLRREGWRVDRASKGVIERTSCL